MPCWQQLLHLDYGEDARILLSGVTCNVSIPCKELLMDLALLFLHIFSSLVIVNNISDKERRMKSDTHLMASNLGKSATEPVWILMQQ